MQQRSQKWDELDGLEDFRGRTGTGAQQCLPLKLEGFNPTQSSVVSPLVPWYL